jgi:hypothetical protein
MNRRLFLLTALLFIATAAFAETPAAATPRPWTQEPAGFGKTRFGASEREVVQSLASTSYCTQSAAGRTCIRATTFGQTRVREAYLFSDDKLGAVGVEFAAADYEAVRAYFVDLYGPPQASGMRTVTTKTGEKHQAERAEWKGTRVSIVLDEVGQNLLIGNAFVVTHEFMARTTP